MIGFIQGLGKTKLLFICAIALMALLGFFGIMISGSTEQLVPLYQDLATSDRYGVTRVLDRIGVEYKVVDDTILVRPDKVRELRVFLATEGLPNGGSVVGYEIFNKEDTFSTSGFTQNVNFYRALEGEIARSIMLFERIKTARVHLVVPKRDVFHKNSQKTTASVVLGVRSAVTLSGIEINAVASLVASAVPGLKVEDVTIVGTDGKPLKLPLDESSTVISAEQREYKLQTEHHMRQMIETLVSRIVGRSKVEAEVSIEMNFEEVKIESETYDPNGQVLRSDQVSEAHEKGVLDGGSVGVANNIPANQSQTGESGTTSSDRTEETKNYEISKERKQSIRKGGEIKKISIAVLVDGTYTQNPATGENIYNPLSIDTINQIKALISSAVGANPTRGDRIEVVNMRFIPEETIKISEEPKATFIETHLYQIIVLASILLTTLLITLLVLKPIIFRIIDAVSVKVMPVDTTTIDEIISATDKITAEITTEEDVKETVKVADEEDLQAKTALKNEINELAGASLESIVTLIRMWLGVDMIKELQQDKGDKGNQ